LLRSGLVISETKIVRLPRDRGAPLDVLWLSKAQAESKRVRPQPGQAHPKYSGWHVANVSGYSMGGRLFRFLRLYKLSIVYTWDVPPMPRVRRPLGGEG